MTLAISMAASAVATLVGMLLVSARLAPFLIVRLTALGLVGLFRNTPLLIQLLFWYFVGFGALPHAVRNWLLEEHPWAALPGNVSLLAPEFLASAWGLGLFVGVFLSEEIQAGLNAIPKGQYEAAASQGFERFPILVYILLPQALNHAFQPIVGQYLNLMKLTSVSCSIGLAELTYQARQIESYNSHAFEAFAAGTLLYLALGALLERLLTTPRRGQGGV